MANVPTKDSKKYFIPLEVTSETIITEEYKNCAIRWWKIGNRMVRAILIPATKEQYYEYMRPLWREDKRQQRHGTDEVSADKVRDDYELEVPDDFNLEETILKEELLAALRQELAAPGHQSDYPANACRWFQRSGDREGRRLEPESGEQAQT